MVCLTKQQQSKINYSKIIKGGVYLTYPLKNQWNYTKMQMKALLQMSLSLALCLSQIKLDQLQCSHVENKNDNVYSRELL